MKRCHGITFFHPLDHFGCDEHGFIEIFHSVNHTVANSLNLVKALDYTIFGIGEHFGDLFDRLFMIGHGNSDCFLSSVGTFEFEEGIFKTDFLNTALCEHFL